MVLTSALSLDACGNVFILCVLIFTLVYKIVVTLIVSVRR